VDDSESVDFAGVGVFPNHEGGDFQPPIISIEVSDGVVSKIKLVLKEDLASDGCFFRDWKFLQQCFMVAEMHSTGAGSGGFSPHFHFSSPFPLSDC
jgi:hypothetical protein